MKCIKAIATTNSYKLGDILRVTDDVADIKVKSGFWAFCPKSEWRALRTPVDTAQNVEKINKEKSKKQSRKQKFKE
jgi:hypothetical protein